MTELDLADVQDGTLYVRLTGGGIVRANVALLKLLVDDDHAPDTTPDLVIQARTTTAFRVVRQADPR